MFTTPVADPTAPPARLDLAHLPGHSAVMRRLREVTAGLDPAPRGSRHRRPGGGPAGPAAALALVVVVLAGAAGVALLAGHAGHAGQAGTTAAPADQSPCGAGDLRPGSVDEPRTGAAGGVDFLVEYAATRACRLSVPGLLAVVAAGATTTAALAAAGPALQLDSGGRVVVSVATPDPGCNPQDDGDAGSLITRDGTRLDIPAGLHLQGITRCRGLGATLSRAEGTVPVSPPGAVNAPADRYSSSPLSTTVGDVDGDGLADRVALDSTDGRLTVTTAAGATATGLLTGAAAEPAIAALARLDGVSDLFGAGQGLVLVGRPRADAVSKQQSAYRLSGTTLVPVLQRDGTPFALAVEPGHAEVFAGYSCAAGVISSSAAHTTGASMWEGGVTARARWSADGRVEIQAVDRPPHRLDRTGLAEFLGVHCPGLDANGDAVRAYH